MDLMREPLVVPDGGRVDAIEVVIRDDGATVNIKVQSDKPSEEIRVFVFSDPTTMAEPRFEQTSLQRDVEVGALAPGNYKVFAVDAGDDFDYSNPETLEKYVAQATSIALAGDQSASVAVNLIRTGE